MQSESAKIEKEPALLLAAAGAARKRIVGGGGGLGLEPPIVISSL